MHREVAETVTSQGPQFGDKKETPVCPQWMYCEIDAAMENFGPIAMPMFVVTTKIHSQGAQFLGEKEMLTSLPEFSPQRDAEKAISARIPPLKAPMTMTTEEETLRPSAELSPVPALAPYGLPLRVTASERSPQL